MYPNASQKNTDSKMASFQSSYRDYAMESEKGLVLDESFPAKLHYMLADVERDGKEHIVGWHHHGRCFSVNKQAQFAEDIMQCYFRQSKFPSFQRQLNLYGFRRVTQGPDKGAYYHELFLRSKPLLATKIERHRIKGTGSRKPAVPEKEPDFHSLPCLPPTDMSKYDQPKGNEEQKQDAAASSVASQARDLLADCFWEITPCTEDKRTRMSSPPAPPEAVAAISPSVGPQAMPLSRIALLKALGASYVTPSPAATLALGSPTLSDPDVAISVALANYDQALASCTARRISQLVGGYPALPRRNLFPQTNSFYFPNF